MYTIVPSDCAHSGPEKVGALLRTVFPKAGLTDAYLHWLYAQNPDGLAVATDAIDGRGTLAAHYATIPIEAKVFGTTERGLLSLNTATHPDHKGKGLFTQLAQATYSLAKEEGYGFVVGVANAASTHGFVKRLGFQCVCPLRAMVGIGDVKQAPTVAPLDFERKWTPERIQWRLANPENIYRGCITDGSITMYSDTALPFVSAVLGSFPVAQVGGQFGTASSFKLKLHLGLDPRADWKRSFYANIPMRFRPSPLNLIFRDLTGLERKLDPSAVVFRAVDFDAY